jgi:hypothetical protein
MGWLLTGMDADGLAAHGLLTKKEMFETQWFVAYIPIATHQLLRRLFAQGHTCRLSVSYLTLENPTATKTPI